MILLRQIAAVNIFLDKGENILFKLFKNFSKSLNKA